LRCVVGGKRLTLGTAEFVASGGEGDIYAVGDKVFKIYHNPAGMIPVGKIQELGAITDPNVIKPMETILSESGAPIGYTMRRVAQTHALCQTFTRQFRDQHNLTPDIALKLVRQMQQTVSNIHQYQCLVVDLNEMNFLVGPALDQVYFIDVDSYQTPHYPATALMESVRDRHMQGHAFNEGTDWFAFGIVTFQMFIGIHPYKGTHASLKGLDARMQANVSVLDTSAVKVPKVCYPFTDIPQAYRDWYMAIFQKGLRLAPPKDLTANVLILNTPMRCVVAGNGVDIQSLIPRPGGSFLALGDWHGALCVLWTTYVYLDDQCVPLKQALPPGALLMFSGTGTPHAVYLEQGAVRIVNLRTQAPMPVTISASQIMASLGRVYLQSGDWLLELFILRDTMPALTNVAAQCVPNATRLFTGVAVQNLLGEPYVTLFMGHGTCTTLPMPALKGYRVVAARHDKSVLIVMASKLGKYERFIFRFAKDLTYDMRSTPDVALADVNFVTLDNGRVVMMTEDENIEVFLSEPHHTAVKRVEDSAIGGDMRLFSVGGRVLFVQNNGVFALKMK